jgi:hypothetical protein
MTTMAILQFRNFVRVSPFADGDYWFLIADLHYELRDTGAIVTVPAGFVTDFASIPRPFWSILPKWGKYGPPSVVHDFLYWDQRCSRLQADRIMALAMRESGVGNGYLRVIYAALRVGGWFAWKANAKARREGRLRKIPDITALQDPTTTWEKYEDTLRKQGVKPEPRPSPDPPPPYCSQVTAMTH